MEWITLEINRRTGKYEGPRAVPFGNQTAVLARQLSDPQSGHPESYRRLTVTFASGHCYVADLRRSYVEYHRVSFLDTAAMDLWLDGRFSDSEIFRRAIRDFSKQLPVVYEQGLVDPQGAPCLSGHQAQPRTESAPDTRTLPLDLFEAQPQATG